MHFSNQGKALQDKRYEFALKQLPAAHHSAVNTEQQQQGGGTNNNNERFNHQFSSPNNHQSTTANPLKTQNKLYLEATAQVANIVRQSKQHGANKSSYFGSGNQNVLNRKQSTLLETNLSYQAHQLQREKQMDAYVRALEQEQVDLERMKEQQRLAALEEARLVDRVKLQQSSRNRICLQQRSHQKVPQFLLEKHGLADAEVQEDLEKQHSHTAEERRQLRELPRQAHIEYNLPRLVDTALNRLERLDAHHERIQRRVELEERVGTDYARKRMKEHGMVRRAKLEARKAMSITSALGGKSARRNDVSNNNNHTAGSSLNFCYTSDEDDDDIVDEDGTGALLLKSSRLPDKEELRVARETAKKNRLLLKEEEEEKKKLWNEMSAIDKQTSEAAKQARLERRKVKKMKIVDDSDSD